MQIVHGDDFPLLVLEAICQDAMSHSVLWADSLAVCMQGPTMVPAAVMRLCGCTSQVAWAHDTAGALAAANKASVNHNYIFITPDCVFKPSGADNR